MYIRFQNSCTFCVFDDYFEIKSDVYNKTFRFKGFLKPFATQLLEKLRGGIQEALLLQDVSWNGVSYETKTIQLIAFLKDNNFLMPCRNLNDSPPENTLYDRQIRFFNSFENDTFSGTDFNHRLQNSKVVIVGLGAYGSWLALHCARLGIKNIIGIDYDIVELSNLHRQVLYTKDDIGLKKVDACSKVIRSCDEEVHYEGICKKISTEAELIPHLEKADIIFNAFGYYPVEDAHDAISGVITKASILTKTPMLCLSNNWLGPLYIPGKSPCYFCTVTHPKIEPILKKVKKNIRVDKRAFCPILSTTCSLAVFEAVCYLTGIKTPSTLDGLRHINPFAIEESSFLPIGINDYCQFCQLDNRMH
jgi:molybdopterin/thiamine biosynthesis adenylyltransferase